MTGPPIDPEGNQVLDVLHLDKDNLEGMIHRSMTNMFMWITQFQTDFLSDNDINSKKLINDIIIELDENLRK